MSKQRKTVPPAPGGDPALDRASALVQEYTGKLRAISRRIRKVRGEYLAEKQRRLEQMPPHQRSSPEQQLWLKVIHNFQSLHDEYVDYVRALFPQAKKLGLHVSQLITHGIDQTLDKIELSLRVAELETALETARALANSPSDFSP